MRRFSHFCRKVDDRISGYVFLVCVKAPSTTEVFYRESALSRPTRMVLRLGLQQTGIKNTTGAARLASIQEGQEETMNTFFASNISRFSRRREEPTNVSPVKTTPPKAPVNGTESWNVRTPWRLRALDAQPSPPFSAASRWELCMQAAVSTVRTQLSERRVLPPVEITRSVDGDAPSVRRASSFGGFPSLHAPKQASVADTPNILEALQGVASATHRRPTPLTTRQPSWPSMQVSLRVGCPKDVMAMREHGQTHLKKWTHEKKSSSASLELARGLFLS